MQTVSFIDQHHKQYISDTYGAHLNMETMFDMVTAEVGKAVKKHEFAGQYMHNALIGIKMVFAHSVTNIGHTASIQETEMLKSGMDFTGDANVFTGKIWFRTKHQLYGLPSVIPLFESSLMRIGFGGYSTWGGLWNDYGRAISHYNVGVPLEKNAVLNAYAYDFHFHTSDIPGFSEFEILSKLADEKWKQEYDFEWQKFMQAQQDEDELHRIKKLHEYYKAIG